MRNFHFVLLYLTIIFFYCETTLRIRRHVMFRKNSKMFLRVNGITPFFKWNTIMRWGWGFRANWDMPDSIDKIHKMYKRNVHNDIDELTRNPEMENFLCLLKYFSDMMANVEYNNVCDGGVLCNIAKIISSSEGDDVKYFKSFFDKLSRVDGSCPAMHYLPLTNEDL